MRRVGSRRQGQGVGAACLPSHGPTDGVGACEGRRGSDAAALHGHTLAHAAARVLATEDGEGRGCGEVRVGHRRLLPHPPLPHQPMAFGGAYATSSAASVGEKAAAPPHGPRGSAQQQRRGHRETRAPASPSDTEKAASPPVPLLWSAEGSGEEWSKDAVEAGPPGTLLSTTARAPRRVPACVA